MVRGQWEGSCIYKALVDGLLLVMMPTCSIYSYSVILEIRVRSRALSIKVELRVDL